MGLHIPYDQDTESFLNNFYTCFPFGSGAIFPNGLRRPRILNNGKEEERNHREIYKDVFLLQKRSRDENYEEHLEDYSDLFLNQTPRAFFGKIDETVIEVGLTLPEITSEIQILLATYDRLFDNKETEADGVNALNRINDFLTPLYIALRNKGYNAAELAR